MKLVVGFCLMTCMAVSCGCRKNTSPDGTVTEPQEVVQEDASRPEFPAPTEKQESEKQPSPAQDKTNIPAAPIPQEAESAPSPQEHAAPTDTPTADVSDPDEKLSAMKLYRKAQKLMKEGKRAEGYQAAEKAKAKFVKDKRRLAWMLLETIRLDNCTIDVHYNLGKDERYPPDDGILRPLSFRIWTKNKSRILEIIDFEIGRWEGEDSTAALGQMKGNAHLNFGTMPPESSYEEILEKLLELVKDKQY